MKAAEAIQAGLVGFHFDDDQRDAVGGGDDGVDAVIFMKGD